MLFEGPKIYQSDSGTNVLNSLYTFGMVGLMTNEHVKEMFGIHKQHEDLKGKKHQLNEIPENVKKDNPSVSVVGDEIGREEERLAKLWQDLYGRIVADLPELKITIDNLVI